MKNIICYGDSNTFGFNPLNGSRYAKNIRWSGVLSNILAEGFNVIEEGLNNRTGFIHNPDGILQSGLEYLPICLEKNKNFDIFIFALGTNDLQFLFKTTKTDITDGLKKAIDTIKQANNNAKIILIPPTTIDINVESGTFGYQFDRTSSVKTQDFKPLYFEAAQKFNCFIIELDDFVKPTETDCIHFSPEGHKIIAEKIAEKVRELK